MSYDEKFYASIRDITVRSAQVVVPIVLMHLVNVKYHVHSVVDVGGGQGWWAKEFNECGVQRVLCLDGSYVTDPVVPFIPIDLEKTRFAHHGGDSDLAVCLEVAEHLDEKIAGRFIDDLCACAPIVLFSAAIPEQGGEHHVNEQPPAYWMQHFQRNNYTLSGYLRDYVWDDERVASWYRQNLCLAISTGLLGNMNAPENYWHDVPPKERIHPATGNPRLQR